MQSKGKTALDIRIGDFQFHFSRRNAAHAKRGVREEKRAERHPKRYALQNPRPPHLCP